MGLRVPLHGGTASRDYKLQMRADLLHPFRIDVTNAPFAQARGCPHFLPRNPIPCFSLS